jgi:hypothetical protein
MITQGELRNQIEYDQDSGFWRWRAAKINRQTGWFRGAPTANGYMTIRVDGKTYYSHTLAWLYVYGEWVLYLDHKNRDKGDNGIVNLRISDKSKNTINSKIRIDNSAGYPGVSYVGGNRKKVWGAYINKDGSRQRAFFETKEEAIAWRKKIEVELFGEFVPKIVASDGK